MVHVCGCPHNFVGTSVKIQNCNSASPTYLCQVAFELYRMYCIAQNFDGGKV